MLTITVRSGALQDAPALTFDAPRIVIGRGSSCEVRLPDSSVSQRHASITQRGSDYVVLDEQSTNGTFVGPLRLAPGVGHVLGSHELLRVGRVWLEISRDPLATRNARAQATKEIALSLLKGNLQAQGEETALVVSVEAGPDAGHVISLDALDRAYVVGRNKQADLALNDEDVSRRHLELRRSTDGVIVHDLGSKNGLRIDERRLQPNQETLWRKHERLYVGQSVLRYEDPLSDALLELETAADELLDLDEVIAPPLGSSSDVAAKETAAHEAAADGVRTTHTKMAAPARPRRASTGAGWGWLDFTVLLLALAMLAASGVWLWWLVEG